MLKFSNREDDILWTRIISVATVFIALVWFTRTFVPLRREIREKTQLVQDIEKDIELQKTSIRRMEAAQIDSVKQVEKLQRLLPRHIEGTATVWLPKLTLQHFDHFRIKTGVIRLNRVIPNEKIPGISHIYESVEIPVAGPDDMKALLLAGAALEERNPTIRLVDFIVFPNPLDPKSQTASLNLEALDRN